MVDPADELELPNPQGIRDEGATPTIVPYWNHWRLRPSPPSGGPVTENGAHHVVAIGEDIRLDDDLVAEGPLRWEPATVDLGCDRLDDHSSVGRPKLGHAC